MTQMTYRQQTPHALLPHANHHHYSTITQPCHKDTTLNQQCCDSKHKREGGLDNTRGSRTMQGAQPNPKTGHHTTTTPRHSIGTQGKRQGGRQCTDGGRQHSTGSQSRCRPSLTMPPTIRYAPHHPRRPHPPPRQGGSAQRIPHHTNSTDTHTTHTPRTRQWNSTRHTLQYSPALQWDE